MGCGCCTNKNFPRGLPDPHPTGMIGRLIKCNRGRREEYYPLPLSGFKHGDVVVVKPDNTYSSRRYTVTHQNHPSKYEALRGFCGYEDVIPIECWSPKTGASDPVREYPRLQSREGEQLSAYLQRLAHGLGEAED